MTFGWAALREKLMAADCAVNGVELELTKLVLIRGSDGSTIADDTELRLIDAEYLTCAWVRSARDEVIEALHVPRARYDEVAADRAGFAALRTSLGAGPFADMDRLLVDVADAA